MFSFPFVSYFIPFLLSSHFNLRYCFISASGCPIAHRTKMGGRIDSASDSGDGFGSSASSTSMNQDPLLLQQRTAIRAFSVHDCASFPCENEQGENLFKSA